MKSNRRILNCFNGKKPYCSTYVTNRTNNDEHHWPLDNLRMLQARNCLVSTFPLDLLTDKKRQQRYKMPFCVYAGFDPTSDSLHIGNLVLINSMLRLANLQWKVFFIIGDSTARLGDPTGKTEDRPILAQSEIDLNSNALKLQIEQILFNYERYFTKNKLNVQIIFNSSWYNSMTVTDFLSENCRNIRIGEILKRQTIRNRLQTTGLSFTEFAYQTFQAYDWLKMYTDYNCIAQMGGVDQLGNIDAGYHLITRQLNDARINQPIGLMTPLLTDSTGNKYGKSTLNKEGQARFSLNPTYTSPFILYQSLINLPDDNAQKSIYLLSQQSIYDINRLLEAEENGKQPPRTMQRYIAEDVVLLVHGEDGLSLARKCTDILYGNQSASIDSIMQLAEDEFNTLMCGATTIAVPLAKYSNGKCNLIDVVCDIKACVNENDAARLVKAGAFLINGIRHTDPFKEWDIVKELFASSEHRWTMIRKSRQKIYFLRWI